MEENLVFLRPLGLRLRVPIASTNGSGPDHTDLLTAAIQKQVMLTPQQDATPPFEVTLYDASGLSAGVITRLDKQLRPQITLSDGRAGLLAVASGHGAPAESIAATAIALAAVRAAGLPLRVAVCTDLGGVSVKRTTASSPLAASEKGASAGAARKPEGSASRTVPAALARPARTRHSSLVPVRVGPGTSDYRYSLNGNWQSCLRRKFRNFL